MSRPISTYVELVAELAKLEVPRPGHVRVFRGQTKNYPTMLPSGVRKQIRDEAVWHSYAVALRKELLTDWHNKSQLLDARILNFSEKEAVWISAIAQHYGPGSNFLDVTRSLDVALWFALHKGVEVGAHHILEPLEAEDPTREISCTESWTEYHRWDAELGFLYVFDVPEFRGEGFPPHGSLLDLLKAASIFSGRKRIKAQAACLIAADKAVAGGDLKCFFACDPIGVQWPMDGAPQLNAPVEEIFPDPSQDEWYKRFVSIPLTYQVHPATGGLSLARPIAVTLYHYGAQGRTNEVFRRIKHVSPTRHDLSDTLTIELVDETTAERIEFRLSEATHILLDAPVMSRFPNADAQMWNHGILAGDMSHSVEAFEFSTDAPCGSVSLTNTYFEISPLEIPNWAQLNNAHGEIQVPGGIWIARSDIHFAVEFFPRLVKSTQVLTHQFSPVYYDYCTNNGTFWTCSVKKGLKTPIVGDKQLDKAFFIALALLRFLSPLKKADPFPLEENSRENGSRTFTIPVRENVVQLKHVFDPKTGFHWYVPRDIISKESFFLEPTAYLGTLLLESDVAWSAVNASAIRRDIAEQCGKS